MTYYDVEEGYNFCGGNVETIERITYFPICILMFFHKKELPDEMMYETDFYDLRE